MSNASPDTAHTERHAAPTVLVNRSHVLLYYVGARIYLRSSLCSSVWTLMFLLVYFQRFILTSFKDAFTFGYIVLLLVSVFAYLTLVTLNAYEYGEQKGWNFFLRGCFAGLAIFLPLFNIIWFNWIASRWLKKGGVESGFFGYPSSAEVKTRWSMLCRVFGLEFHPLRLFRHHPDFSTRFKSETEI